MVKRARDDDVAAPILPSRKRARLSSEDRLSTLSDELILRILSNLPVSQLLSCQRYLSIPVGLYGTVKVFTKATRLSQKFKALAGDSQLWKSLYYNRFVRPRASRLPGLKDLDDSTGSLYFASKASRWLGDEHLVRRGGRTNWKRQYKLRHNWSKGSCAVNEIHVAEQAPIPPVLVQMHNGTIYMADQTDGLRAWSAKGDRKMLAQAVLGPSRTAPPTAIAVDPQPDDETKSWVAVGFEDGSISLYSLEHVDGRFVNHLNHKSSANGVISAIALSYPYAATMTATQQLTLYQFDESHKKDGSKQRPRILHSLKSNTVWPPLTTSLRISDDNIIISIAYALPTYLSGWTVGIQEIRLDRSGRFLTSRVASAIEQHYRPLAFASPPMMHHLSSTVGSLATSTATELRHIHSKPTSLSYTHPYLLVSHPDNTLTLYLVASTTESLSISAGSRLWGHTSSVSGAHVGGRGKAVSVSRRGDELRVWELEGGFSSIAAKRRLASGDLSVQLRPKERPATQDEVSLSGIDLVNNEAAQHISRSPSSAEQQDDVSELTITRGWIGFDDENVVVLKERSQGRQALVVYDFT